MCPKPLFRVHVIVQFCFGGLLIFNHVFSLKQKLPHEGGVIEMTF